MHCKSSEMIILGHTFEVSIVFEVLLAKIGSSPKPNEHAQIPDTLGFEPLNSDFQIYEFWQNRD